MARNPSLAGLRRPSSFSFGAAAAVIGLLALAVLLGLATVVLPPGFLIRALVVPVGLSFLAFAWVLRHKGAGMPGRWVLQLLLGTACLSIIWPRYIFFSLGGPHVNPQTLSVFASFAAVLFWLIKSPEMSAKFSEVAFSKTKIGVLIFVWFVWRFFASALGEYPLASIFDYLRDFAYLSSFFVIGCVIASYQDGPKWLLRVIVFAGLLVAMAGLVEAFAQKNLFARFASGADSEAVADGLRSVTLDKIRGGSYRAQSVFTHPIVFAQFIAAMIPLAAYCAVYERTLFWRMVGVLLIPIGVLAIVKSGSRSGLVSLATAVVFCAVIVWLRSMNSKGLGKAVAIAALPAFLVGIGVAYFAVQELVVGRTQVEAGSSAIRMRMVEVGVNALMDSPISGFGHGLALFKAGVSNSSGIETIDSYWLSIALDSGYVGLIIFLAIVAMIAVRGAVAAVRLPGDEGARVGLIVAAILALVATFAGLSIPNNMTLMWLLVALALPSLNKAATPVPSGR